MRSNSLLLLLFLGFMLASLLPLSVEARGGGRGGGGRSSGGRSSGGRSSSGGRGGWFRSSSSSSSSSGRSWFRSSSSSSSVRKTVSPSSYPKQKWGFSSSSSASLSSKTGVRRISTYVPRTSYVSSSGGYSGGGFKSTFSKGNTFNRKVSLDKKSVGLGAAAGFIAGRTTSHIGTTAYHGVVHRYLQYKYLKHTYGHRRRYYYHHDDDDDDWDDGYGYTYSEDGCSFSCPPNSRCVLGICECRESFTLSDGKCKPYTDYMTTTPELVSCATMPGCLSCPSNTTCQFHDINLVCTNFNVCKCRENMKWNSEVSKCQLYLDADCSSFGQDSTASQNLVNAVENINQTSQNNISSSININDVNKTSMLSTSILDKISLKNLTEHDLLEAYCRDVEAFMADLEGVDRRPQLCPRVPATACAIVFDSHDCSGGWKYEVRAGSINFPYFSYYWSYRNDIDTVGVRAGCTLEVYSSTYYQGNKGVFKAESTDNWWVLEDSEETEHLANDIESLKCYCYAAQIKDLFE